MIFNRDGSGHETSPMFPQLSPAPPRSATTPVALPPLTGPAPPATPPPALDRANWPACTAAGGSLYCMDLQGAIRRGPLAGGERKPIATGRRGTTLAAAPLPEDHTVVAFLADRKTTEGVVTQAFIALDDSPAVPLSEDGAGATFVTLMPWKDGALAMYIDARAALTPVHARMLRRTAQGQLALGPDAVIFVGGGFEARMAGALTQTEAGSVFALIPTSHSDSGFGMAAIRLSDPPRIDEPVVWSMYPNGLSPAPITATRGRGPPRVVRARPSAPEPGAKAVLELGHLLEDGSFAAHCIAAKAGSFTHVAMEPEHDGSVWLTYTTSDGTWLEQRGGSMPRSGGPARRVE
ncbi:hypothetical protein [Chondromyces crocatus]|uniref:hypothetical protein n=1 Tax=Chondromyces crocatus TaxID=52 RepID=UPI0009E824FB|nr:hypothetical protein [Chondromyces crocatus]